MDEIALHHQKACELAIVEVEKLARQVMIENPKLHEFVMAMGVVCFFNMKGMPVELADIPGAEALEDLFLEWDDILKLTGEPMRFTRKGPVRKDW